MRRLSLAVFAFVLILPASAVAKGSGVAFQPALSALQPGVAADVHVVFLETKPPPPGTRPVVVLRSGTRVLRLTGAAVTNAQTTVHLTLPRPTGARWTAQVLVAGRARRVLTQPSFRAGADAFPVIYTRRRAAQPPAEAASTAPAWPFAAGGAAVLGVLGMLRRRRRA